MESTMDKMKNPGSKIACPRLRGGYALLIVLVAVVIGMLLYSVYMGGVFAPGLERRRAAPPSRPWLEADRILGPDKIIEMPEAPRPTITGPIDLVAFVTRDGTDRGTMTLRFDVDGTVRGKWHCRYSHDEQNYVWNSEFAGNIDVNVTCTSEDGKKDRSLLYFITKGRYTQYSTNAVTHRQSRQDGEIYVTGCLAPDYSARGLITITTDRTWSVTYRWQTGRKP